MIPLIDDAWYTVDQLSDLQKMMKLFLTGHIEASPWHYGALQEESYPLVNSLLELNAAGIIPFGSQPGMQERFRLFRQRSYLEALVSPSELSKFEQLRELGYEVAVVSNDSVHPVPVYRMPVTQYRFISQTFSPGSASPVPATMVMEKSHLSQSADRLYHGLATVFITEREWGTNNLWSELKAVFIQN